MEAAEPEAGAAVCGAGAAVADGGRVSAPFWPQAPSATAVHTIVRIRTIDTLEACTFIRRILFTMTAPTAPLPAADALPEAEYRRLSHAVLASIETTVDQWLEDDVVDIDSHRTGGLLELSFPNGSKLVINTQPPLQELWLAARSGGFHYRNRAGRWVDTRDGGDFFERLSACASEQAGKTLRFLPPEPSKPD